MLKTVIRSILTLGALVGTWYALSLIPWVDILGVSELRAASEKKLADATWSVYKETIQESHDPIITDALDSLVKRLASENHIDASSLSIHLVQSGDINAFALPGNHIVVHSALIKSAESDNELCGVLAHEIAHTQRGHLTKKLVKEVGLSSLLTVTNSEKAAQIVREVIKHLTSTAFDREMEREADLYAVRYMERAHVDPRPLAHFMMRLPETNTVGTIDMSWASTHPNSHERAATIISLSDTVHSASTPALPPDTWKAVKKAIASF